MTVATPRAAGATRSSTQPQVGIGPGIVAPSWRRSVPLAVAYADLVAGVVAVLLALRLRWGPESPDLRVEDASVSYLSAALLVAAVWPGVLAALGAHRSVVTGSGSDDLGRVVEAGLSLFAALAVLHLLLDTNLSGRLVAMALGLMVAMTLAVHMAAHEVMRRGRRQNRWHQRAVVYGSDAEAATLARQFARPDLGVDVVAAFVVDGGTMGELVTADEVAAARAARAGATGVATHVPEGAGTTGVATPDPASTTHRAGAGSSVGEAALRALATTRADLLAVAGGTSPAEVRALAWALEGTGAELMIAPAVPDLGQQRVVVESVGGVVFLRVDECRQQRGRLLLKSAMDRVGAALLLVLLAPLFAVIGLAVKRSSPGPVFYSQTRVGQHGTTFPFHKFRTMVADADRQVDGLADRNESDGLLFKVHDDPRVTDIGRFLRRMSLDELPQLWNVLRGEMSLVGPRPLPVDADAFEGDARRRLRVRPGITGLWQVSGRSDLAWSETVALDMHYVDHWSLGLDLMILARTPATVLRGRGAY